MSWEIDRSRIHEYVDLAIDRIMSTPMPMDLVDALITADAPDEVIDGAYAAWISAGLSVEIGQEFMSNPERFLTETP